MLSNFHIKILNSLVCDRFIDTSKTEYLTPMTYSATLSMAYSRMYHSPNSFSNRDSLCTNDDNNNNKPSEEAQSQRKKPLSFQKQNITATTHFQSPRKKNIASRPSPAAEEEVEENTASNKFVFLTG